MRSGVDYREEELARREKKIKAGSKQKECILIYDLNYLFYPTDI